MDKMMEKQNSSSFSHPKHNIWKCHQSFSNRKKITLYCKKKVVLLTISLFMSNWEKAPIPYKPSTFIQKGRDCWVAQSNLWDSQLFTSNVSLFSNVFYKIVTNYKSDQSFTRRVPLGCPETSSMPKLQRWCLQRHKVPETECWSQTSQPGSL